jgi:hypothetical protein
MICEIVELENGTRAIVCHRPRRCSCGKPGRYLCDWITKRDEAGKPIETCSKPVCLRCTTIPAPDKDLCKQHAAQWQAMQAKKRGAAA